MSGRLPVVGVMGSGTTSHAGLAGPLGAALGRMDVHLLTGGGGGVMASVSRAFATAEGRGGGLVIGVLPCAAGRADEAPPGYPNPWVEIEIRTHLNARAAQGASAMSRNHVNVLSSDVVVALPGGEGTASEIALAMRHGRPLALFGRDDRAGDLPASDGPVAVADTVEEALSFVSRHLPARTTGPVRVP